MDIRTLTGELSVAPQIVALDLKALADAGFKSVICNRPDGEGADQPNFDEIERAAGQHGLHSRYLPAESGKVTDDQGAAFGALMAELPKPVLAYCRTGMRSTTMWALTQAGQMPLPQIIERSSKAGFDLKGVVRRIVNGGKTPVEVADATHEVVIIGGGAAGISVASSLLATQPGPGHRHHRPGRHPLLPARLDPGGCRRLRSGHHRAHDGQRAAARRALDQVRRRRLRARA